MTSKAHEDSLCEPASHPTDKLLRSEVVACPQEPTNQDPSPAGKAETTTTTTTGDTQESSEVASAVGSDPNPATTADPPQLAPKTTEQILANKRSWLTAFAWRKEPEANPPVPEPISTRSDSPEGQSKQDPPVHLSPQPIDAVVAVTQTKEDLRPQDSTSQLQDVTKSQPRPETAKDNVSTSPKPQLGPLDTLHPADKSGSTTSLGATPTKFTLGMPLLGRPKVPLEKAMADARKEDSGSAQKAQSESRPKENREQGAVSATQPQEREGPTIKAVSETETSVPPELNFVGDGDHDRRHAPAAQASGDYRARSWWAWWGHDSGNQPHIDAEHTSAPEDVSDVQRFSDREGDVSPQLRISRSTQLKAECTEHVITKSENSDKVTSGIPDKVTPVVSDDSGKPQDSVWYSPWTWYQTSSSAGAPSDGDGSASTDAAPQPTVDQQTVPTGSEMSHPSSTADTDNSATGPINPIQTSIADNRAGWISFFSGRAVAMKSITYEKEGGEMEVMDIDEEVNTAQGTGLSSSPNSTSAQGSPTKMSAQSRPPLQPGQQILPVNQGPSPGTKKPDGKQAPKISAAITSETAVRDAMMRQPSPTPSKKSGVKTPTTPPPPNVVLPTWTDVFHTPPRSIVPETPPSALSKAFNLVAGALFAKEEPAMDKGKSRAKAREGPWTPHEKALPRAWSILEGDNPDILRGCRRIVVIGVHGWFPGAVARTFIGEPTGTSSKFVNRVVQALDEFQDKHRVKLTKITKIPLEGEGTINRRVEKLYQILVSNEEWMNDLREADAIFVATHSQGSVVSTHILDRLIADRHIRTTPTPDASLLATGVASGSVQINRPPQRICCMALCGIHLGPLRYLNTSSLLSPYIHYFESTAARELFEFQDTESAISKDYVRALRNVLDNGIKMLYVASLNDQVVGLYSGLFTSVSHPLILRALYIDGDAYHSSDFLSKLLVLLLRIRNAGLSDSGLLTHLSEATAGSLNGIGHSTPYEELATYTLAVNYLFLADCGCEGQVELRTEPFNALTEQNDYEIPWALRDLIADDRVTRFFSDELVSLRDAFRDWHPKTAILREVKRKLQPIQRLSVEMLTARSSSMSKL